MKRDIKVNYGKVDEVIDGVGGFKKALEDMEEALRNIHKLLQNSTGESIDAINKDYEGVFDDIDSVKEELGDLYNIFTSYKSDMHQYIKPVNPQAMTRVSRNDIYWNMNSISNAVDSITPNSFGNLANLYPSMYEYGDYDLEEMTMEQKAERNRQRRNGRKINEIRDSIIPAYVARLQATMEEMWSIHRDKVIPYENMDDEYNSKAWDLYWKYTNFFEGVKDVFKWLGKTLWAIIDGIFTAIWDFVTGLLSLAAGVVCYLGAGVVLLVCKPFGAEPAFAKDFFDSSNETLGTLLNDPFLIVEGLVQNTYDGYEEKGIFYTVSYLVTDWVLIDLAIDKIKAKFKASKYADEVADTGKVTGTTTIDDLLKRTTCSTDDLYRYLKKIDPNKADDFLKTGVWPDGIQVPKSPKVLKSDGSINWNEVPNGGYTLKADGTANKKDFVPQVGEVIDRYGPPDGRYTSPVIDGIPYTYDQRSLPYVEDIAQYHQYEIVGDFTKIENYVNNLPSTDLKVKIEAYINRYYGGDYSRVKAYKGDIASGFGSTGKGVQYELPMPVEWLEELGVVREIQ